MHAALAKVRLGKVQTCLRRVETGQVSDWTGRPGLRLSDWTGLSFFFYNNFYYITMEVTLKLIAIYSYEYVTEIKECLKESKEDELKIS